MVNLTLLEHDEQVLVVQWCDWSKIPIFAIPNGTNKGMMARIKHKAEGLRPGVPDLFIPIINKHYGGLFIEMKRVQGSTVSSEQKKWRTLLTKQGYKSLICYGNIEAIEAIKEYLKEV